MLLVPAACVGLCAEYQNDDPPKSTASPRCEDTSTRNHALSECKESGIAHSEQPQSTGAKDGKKLSRAEKENQQVLKELRKPNRLQAATAFLADSSGNRVALNFQGVRYEIRRGLTMDLQMEERWLWRSHVSTVSTLWTRQNISYRFSRLLAVEGGVGAVRYPVGSTKVSFHIDTEVHPLRQLRISGGFVRMPVVPTYDAAVLKISTQGWRGQADWQSRSWHINGEWSRYRYSDHNKGQHESAGIVRWQGPVWAKIGLGYEVNHYSFLRNSYTGYFSPGVYTSHLGVLGLRIYQRKKRFRSEYLTKIGMESIGTVPSRYAWEATVRNELQLRRWAIQADYSYLHLAQATGAFRAHVPRLIVTYSF